MHLREECHSRLKRTALGHAYFDELFVPQLHTQRAKSLVGIFQIPFR